MRNDDVGDVGDLIFATVNAGCWSLLAPRLASPLSLFCFRLRVVSSLYSLIRMDLLVWGISSDDDEDWILGRLSNGVSKITVFSPISGSDSEVAAENESLVIGLRLSSFCCAFRRPFFSILEVTAGFEASEEPNKPTACAVDFLPFLLGRIRPSLRTGSSGEKYPF